MTDAALAAALAVKRGPAGIYDIVQDGASVGNRLARDLLGWGPTRR